MSHDFIPAVLTAQDNAFLLFGYRKFNRLKE
jgi:hypothetical protein